MLNWFGRILRPPWFEDEEQTRVARLLYVTLLLLLGASVLGMLAIFQILGVPASVGDGFVYLAGALFVLMTLICLVWMRRGRIRRAAWTTVGMLWLVMTGWAWVFGGISTDRSSYVYPLIIVIAGLLLGTRGAAVFTGLSVVSVLGSVVVERQGLVAVQLEPVDTFDLLVMLLVLALIGALLRYAVKSMLNAVNQARLNELAQQKANRELEAIRSSLEQRVIERTQDLERRSFRLQAVVEIGRAAASVRSAEALLQAVVEMTSARLGSHYVGLYLLDESRGVADLRAAYGEYGKERLVAGHRVALDGDSRLATVMMEKSAELLTLPEDAQSTDEVGGVPYARSGVVLSLVAGDRLLGALELFSPDPETFIEGDLAVLQAMAGQLAVAIENAQLFAATQQALEMERRVYQQLSREGWVELLREGVTPGFRYVGRETHPIDDTWYPEMAEAIKRNQRVLSAGNGGQAQEARVAVPIRVRGQVIGVIDLSKAPDRGQWTQRELGLLDTLVAELEQTLENARLYRATQRRAVRERVTREISDNIRSALTVEDAMRRAVTELGRILGVSELVARLGTETTLLSQSGGIPHE